MNTIEKLEGYTHALERGMKRLREQLDAEQQVRSEVKKALAEAGVPGGNSVAGVRRLASWFAAEKRMRKEAEAGLTTTLGMGDVFEGNPEQLLVSLHFAVADALDCRDYKLAAILSEAHKKLQAAEQDTARLDWLDEGPVKAMFLVGADDAEAWRWEPRAFSDLEYDAGKHGPDLREAIDAAVAATKGEQEDSA